MPPIRPPDTRRDVGMPTRLQRRYSSRQSTAYDLTNRIFNSVLPFFGQRTRMPLVYFQGRTPGQHPLLDIRRESQAGRAEAAAYSRHEPWARPTGVIAFPHAADRALNDPVTRQHITDVLLHEMAHTQQSPIYGPTRRLRIEGGADAFAALTRDYVARRLGWGQQAAMPFQGGYGMLGPRYVGRFGADRATFGQFGQRGHYGPEVLDLPPLRPRAGIGAGASIGRPRHRPGMMGLDG